MQFDKNIPIYIQIEDFIKEKIFHLIWTAQARIPSVRELAEVLEVNPNTVMRAYDSLEKETIIFNQRGIGFFVSDDAVALIKNNRTHKFFTQLPLFFKTMDELNIDVQDIQVKWSEYVKTKIESK